MSPGNTSCGFVKVTTPTQVQDRLRDLVAMALAGELDHWAQIRPGLVALVLLLDQFTRNIYRDTRPPLLAIRRPSSWQRRPSPVGRHPRLPAIHRVFLYLPLEHSENLEDQDRCVTLLTGWPMRWHEQFQEFARYAHAHRQVIAQFGRFPHRNAILSRESTEASWPTWKNTGVSSRAAD